MKVGIGMTPQALRHELSRLTEAIITIRAAHKRHDLLLKDEIKGLEALVQQRNRDINALKVLLAGERRKAREGPSGETVSS